MNAHQRSKTRPAELVHLSRALDSLGLLIFAGEDWISPAALLEFTGEVEEQVRALKGLIGRYVEHSKFVRPGGDPEIEEILKVELADTQKQFGLLAALRRATSDFSAEAEELRKLRSGELKIKTLSASKESRP